MRRRGGTSLLLSLLILLASLLSVSNAFVQQKRQNCMIPLLQQQVSTDDTGNDETTYYSPNVPLSSSTTTTTTKGETTAKSNSNNNNDDYSFFDQAVLSVQAGSGGAGASTYTQTTTRSRQRGPPDGGHGGRGGHVYLQLDHNMNTLAKLSRAGRRPNAFGGSGAATKHKKRKRPLFVRAPHGQAGSNRFQTGRNGQDVVIRVPAGTIVYKQPQNDNDSTTTTKKECLGTVNATHPLLLVAEGGTGGEGTGIYKNTRGYQRPRASPTAGERHLLQLELIWVADVALVGVPNAGKSTLLNSVSNCQAKIANYPFTTIVPNLGVWQCHKNDAAAKNNTKNRLVLCDVPGLIAGAAHGSGLGHLFLRHVERCTVVLHILDATSNDPVADYQMLNTELVRYSAKLATVPQVVVVNKVDVWERTTTTNDNTTTMDAEAGLQPRWSRQDVEEQLKEVLPHARLLWMSARQRDGVQTVMERLAAFVQKVQASKP